MVSLFGPAGQMIRERDSEKALQRIERISEVTDQTGAYRLEIRAATKEAAGRYEVTIRTLREASAEDKLRVAAERVFQKAQDLDERGSGQILEKALENYKEALSLWRAAGDREGEALALGGIGIIYWYFAEFDKSLDYSKQALAIWQESKDAVGQGRALNNIGQSYNALGKNQEALNAFNESLAIWRALGKQSDEARTLNNLALVYTALNEPHKSLEHLKRSLALRRSVQDHRGEAITLHNMAGAYFVLEEYQNAQDCFAQALALRPAGDLRGRAKTLGDMGILYSRLGDKQKAMQYHIESLALKRKVRDPLGEAITLHNIGQLHSALGDKQKALEYYNLALEIHRQFPDPGEQASVLASIAELERDRGDIAEARRRIEAALDIVESLRAGVASEELRASYLASKQSTYRFYIDLLMRQHKSDPLAGHDQVALTVAERARARSLLETLAEARVNIREGVDPHLLERVSVLYRQLNDSQRRRVQLLTGPHTDEEARTAEHDIDTLRSQYQELGAQIRAASPRYAALTQPAPLGHREIQQLLDDDTLLLEYALGEERSFLWAVTKESIASFELPREAVIEEAARRTHQLLTVSHTRQRKRESELAAAELSRMLLGPVADRLEQRRLVIVADGALQYIPFAALPTPLVRSREPEVSRKLALAGALKKPGIIDHESGPLILGHEIVNLPSASVLGALRREMSNRKPASRLVAVLADPVLGPDDVRVTQAGTRGETRRAASVSEGRDDLRRSAEESGLTALERLRFTRQEAEAILALARGGKTLKALDFEASRKTATSAELEDYRIVHFATHALINSQHPELSGIVLSLVDEKGRRQDGFLRADDIYNLKLSADLVVLSACRTALGKQIKGEGLVGLVRGFMYSGAPRVVASLWDVKDDATAELMKRFYKAMLVDGLSPAAALRRAQVAMFKEGQWSAPYYWAGFVIEGDWK